MLFAAFRVGASRHGAAGAPQGCPGSGSDLGTAVSTVSLASPKSPWGRGGLVGARRCLHGPGEPLEGAARMVHSLNIALLQQDHCEGLFQLKKSISAEFPAAAVSAGGMTQAGSFAGGAFPCLHHCCPLLSQVPRVWAPSRGSSAAVLAAHFSLSRRDPGKKPKGSRLAPSSPSCAITPSPQAAPCAIQGTEMPLCGGFSSPLLYSCSC